VEAAECSDSACTKQTTTSTFPPETRCHAASASVSNSGYYETQTCLAASASPASSSRNTPAFDALVVGLGAGLGCALIFSLGLACYYRLQLQSANKALEAPNKGISTPVSAAAAARHNARDVEMSAGVRAASPRHDALKPRRTVEAGERAISPSKPRRVSAETGTTSPLPRGDGDKTNQDNPMLNYAKLKGQPHDKIPHRPAPAREAIV
jgi:hypothetical protein